MVKGPEGTGSAGELSLLLVRLCSDDIPTIHPHSISQINRVFFLKSFWYLFITVILTT